MSIDESGVNSEVLAWFKSHSNSDPPHIDSTWNIEGYERHSHPDLVEAMDSLISPHHNVLKAFSHGYRIHFTNDTIFAIAIGMVRVALRYPEAKLRANKKLFTEIGPDWILVEIFGNEVYLKAFYHVAYRLAGGEVRT